MRWLVVLVLALAPAAAADPAALRVIVNAKNPAKMIDKRELAEAFLKKRTRWDDDTAILPVDLNQRSSVRERFSHDVLGRDVASVRRYWAQIVFSGRGVAPPELASEADVVKYVAAHAGAIGYVASGTDLTGVKAVEVE
jgi:ABC-type phosphate transport system substrate-binding protein